MNNITLIGMPGAGKSTLGVLLAKAVNYRFIDTDLLIQEQEGRLLCDIIREEGMERFRQIEQEVNARFAAERTVIAPGGSVIYAAEAMAHFKEIGRVIYLCVSYEEISRRVGDLTKRGVVCSPGQDLQSLYRERTVLYEKYADAIVYCDGKREGELLSELHAIVSEKR